MRESQACEEKRSYLSKSRKRHYGRVPWVSLGLGFESALSNSRSFLKKRQPVDGIRYSVFDRRLPKPIVH